MDSVDDRVAEGFGSSILIKIFFVCRAFIVNDLVYLIGAKAARVCM